MEAVRVWIDRELARLRLVLAEPPSLGTLDQPEHETVQCGPEIVQDVADDQRDVPRDFDLVVQAISNFVRPLRRLGLDVERSPCPVLIAHLSQTGKVTIRVVELCPPRRVQIQQSTHDK